ncbi:hypothetical protein ACJX0J_029835, partial [Zea mays]
STSCHQKQINRLLNMQVQEIKGTRTMTAITGRTPEDQDTIGHMSASRDELVPSN